MALLFSDSFGDEVLTAWFGGDTCALPASWEMSLWTGNPFDGGVELSTGAYARVVVSKDNFFNDTAASGIGAGLASSNPLRFPSDTDVASADWAAANHIAFSRGVGDPPEMAMRLPGNVTVLNGDYLEFEPLSLIFEFGTTAQPPLIYPTWALTVLKELLQDAGPGNLDFPATWYAGLWLDNPFNGGSEVSTSGTSYARIAITNDTGNFVDHTAADGARARKCAATIRWPATGVAAGAFGLVKYIGFAPASSGSPRIALPLPDGGRTIAAGSFLSLPSNACKFALRSFAFGA